jgi:alpha-N-arabinofuranosidase
VNQIKIDPDRRLSDITRHIFGGFVEHLGRCIYGGIYEPGSPLADEQGFRTDVLEALRRLRMPILRYPGGNFVSGYCWRDGVGPLSERPPRSNLAWGSVESNQFGTNEFITFCRKVNAKPYLVVNCGDGDLREARDWVEYCNGTWDTELVRLRRQHGVPEPHRVRFWGVGNEVDGPWQIGMKTPEEYARAYLEFSKVMRWVDPSIKLVASVTSAWDATFVERAQLLIEQAADYVDYLSIHWYVGNQQNDFPSYMATSEIIEDRLSAFEGLIRALRFQQRVKRSIALAVDEWNVWYRTTPIPGPQFNGLEEIYNLEDALVIALHLNAFIRHAATVRMANLAQIVNVIAPIFTRPDGLVRQTTYYPFELYSRTCGPIALDVFWQGDTFSTADHTALRVLDVAATLDEQRRSLSLYVVNRSETEAQETTISLDTASFSGPVQGFVINGPDIKAENTFDQPHQVGVSSVAVNAERRELTYTFEPHSITVLVCTLD